MKKRNKSQRLLTGYRLHDYRLSWAENGTAIRTIKFPLYGDDIPALTKNIASDY